MSFGQWRRFSVQATSEEAANLFVTLSSRVSKLLIRDGAPPTAEQSDAAALIDAQDGAILADAQNGALVVGADGAPMPSTMPSTALMSVSASPDNPFASRTWHVAVYLAGEIATESLRFASQLPSRECA